MSTPDRHLTRRALLARASGLGAAIVLGGEVLGDARALTFPATEIRRFVSRPDLIPPKVDVVSHPGTTASGLLFLGPSSGPGQRGAMIVDDAGELVWFHPTVPATVMNFRAALFHGEPVLTWWEGKTKHGLGVGEHVVFDRTYRELARFPIGSGLGSDLHELILTPTGTALVTAYDVPTVDRSSVGHGRGRVIDGIVQELELPRSPATGPRVLFQWSALDHVKLTESYSKVAPAFDFFHINSIDLASDGNLIVSSRNTWTIYKLDRTTGKIMWRLGGKKSDFALGPGTRFAWQHDARVHAGGDLLTVFDNADDPQVQPQTRGLVLNVDEGRRHVSLARQYLHRPKLLAHAFGSVQLQPNGNVLVGWGTEPYFTEYASTGAVVLDAKLPHGGQNYRTLRFPWDAVPAEPPRLTIRATGAGHLLHVSWNGATGVRAWQAFGGAASDRLSVVRTVPKRGFETVIHLPAGPRYVAVAAIDAAGKTFGRSAVAAL